MGENVCSESSPDTEWALHMKIIKIKILIYIKYLNSAAFLCSVKHK